MRFRSSGFALVLGLLSLVVVAPVHAGTIILSGDTNIINPAVGTFGQAVDPGNVTWFTNILQGGTSVLLQHGGGGGSSAGPANTSTPLNTFYSNMAGVSSSILGGAVTGASLAGVDLFISILPAANYAAIEIAAMANFLDGGGTLFFLGEVSIDFFLTENTSINNALVGLGSGMSINIGPFFDPGFQTMPGNGGTIFGDPLTAGVNTFTYASPSEVVVNGGTSLFLGSGQQPFIAYETTKVPEPSTIFLLGTGLVGLGVFRKFTG